MFADGATADVDAVDEAESMVVVVAVSADVDEEDGGHGHVMLGDAAVVALGRLQPGGVHGPVQTHVGLHVHPLPREKRRFGGRCVFVCWFVVCVHFALHTHFKVSN